MSRQSDPPPPFPNVFPLIHPRQTLQSKQLCFTLRPHFIYRPSSSHPPKRAHFFLTIWNHVAASPLFFLILFLLKKGAVTPKLTCPLFLKLYFSIGEPSHSIRLEPSESFTNPFRIRTLRPLLPAPFPLSPPSRPLPRSLLNDDPRLPSDLPHLPSTANFTQVNMLALPPLSPPLRFIASPQS